MGFRREEKETLLLLEAMFDLTAAHDRGQKKPFFSAKYSVRMPDGITADY